MFYVNGIQSGSTELIVPLGKSCESDGMQRLDQNCEKAFNTTHLKEKEEGIAPSLQGRCAEYELQATLEYKAQRVFKSCLKKESNPSTEDISPERTGQKVTFATMGTRFQEEDYGIECDSDAEEETKIEKAKGKEQEIWFGAKARPKTKTELARELQQSLLPQPDAALVRELQRPFLRNSNNMIDIYKVSALGRIFRFLYLITGVFLFDFFCGCFMDTSIFRRVTNKLDHHELVNEDAFYRNDMGFDQRAWEYRPETD